MKRILTNLILMAVFTNVEAQTAKDSVVLTINNFFTGMKNADTALLKNTLAPTAILHTINDGDGNTKIEDGKINALVSFVGQLTPGVADEQITVETVKIDGALASVWTPYKFYYKGNFSHCGVNSFQLVRINNEWKIQYIIDTRRKSGCL